jgi:hypothetical protein
MRTFVLFSLSTLCLTVCYSNTGLAATAIPTTAFSAVSIAQNPAYAWTAEDVAQAAYEGHLQDEGIPGYTTLAEECRGGFTTGRDVLRAAVKAGWLPSRVMNDAGYLEQLRINLSEDLNVPVR